MAPDARRGLSSQSPKATLRRPTLAAFIAEERVLCPERVSREALAGEQPRRVEIDVDGLSGGKDSRRRGRIGRIRDTES